MSGGPHAYKRGAPFDDPDLDDEDPLRWRLGEADRYVRGWFNPVTRASGRPASKASRVAVIRCDLCPQPGRSKSSPVLAEVWKTPLGLLFRAELVFGHEITKAYTEGVVLVHPNLPDGENIVEVPIPSAEVLRKSGWIDAAEGTQAPTGETSLFVVRVRDLIDAEGEHPPLRVKCRGHGEELLDRTLLRRYVREATRSSTQITLT